jgi:pimeloyl-ACP methyl ester carboxylesterase
MVPSPSSNPAHSFKDALERIPRLCALDDDSIHPLSRTRLWSHGAKTQGAILYLHGYTDSLQQFAALGDALFGRGYNVFAPRLPYHGFKDRMTSEHSRLTANEIVDWTNTATDIAKGLGDALTVIGLSLGGVLATWVAVNRSDVDRVLIISPAYGTSIIPSIITVPVATLVNWLPNRFIWWDSRAREHAGFEYTYPRFSTRTLAQAFLLGNELLQQARAQPPASRTVWMITNANDFDISNALCAEFVNAWRAHNTNQVWTYEFPRELGIPHDIMDPAEPGMKPEIVYPRLIEIVEQDLSTRDSAVQSHNGPD